MTTTVQVLGSIEDIISCPVCMDTYKKPKVLPCQHAFCLECLFTAYQDGSRVSPFMVRCPVCRDDHVMRAFSMTIDDFDRQFPNHFVLLALLEAKEKAIRQQLKLKSCDETNNDQSEEKTIVKTSESSTSQEDSQGSNNLILCLSRRCPNGAPSIAEAKWHCLMCDIQLCNECVYEHFNNCIEHEIINLDDQMTCYEEVIQRNTTIATTGDDDDAPDNEIMTVWEEMWKGYTDMLIRSAACLVKAVIIGAYSAQVLGRSQPPVGRDFHTDVNELKRMCQIFREIRGLGSSTSALTPDHCVLEGIRYELGSARDNVLYGQKPGGGFFAMKTRVSIVVGVYAGDFQDAIAAGAAVQQISEILRESFY